VFTYNFSHKLGKNLLQSAIKMEQANDRKYDRTTCKVQHDTKHPGSLIEKTVYSPTLNKKSEHRVND